MTERAIDPKAMAEKIVEAVGGRGNIESVTHCFTRLRLVLADTGAANDEAVNAIPGVQGILFRGGQYQIVLGRQLYPVFAAVKECCRGSGPPAAPNPEENNERQEK